MVGILFLFLFPIVLNASPLFIDDVHELEAIEKSGFSFSEQISLKKLDSLNELYMKNISYKLVADTVITDLSLIAKQDQRAGVTMKYSHRLFNGDWLKSKNSRFELAGVVLRADRAFRHPKSCGEIRLIYRLAYQDVATQTYSRLPMTIQHVRIISEDPKMSCEKLLKDWKPLSVLQKSEPYDFELNLQSLRWPSAIRPDMGTYAEYLMRAFIWSDGQLQLRKLDHVLDLEKLSQDTTLKKELLSWLKNPANLLAVDRGEAVLAEKFLTDKAVSIAVHGLNRRANQLFTQVFTEADLKGLDYSKLDFIKSPLGYLRKLDEMTCVGCHQSKSIAGFHFVGKDRVGSVDFNKVKVPFSHHFATEQKRRADRAFLGFADRPINANGEKNDRCYVGEDISFKKWNCKSGLKCEPVGSAEGKEFFGICQEPKIALVGDACYFGRVAQNKNPKKEKEINHFEKSCEADLGCLRPSDGYPGGLCFANYCKNTEDKSCAMLAVDGFNPCLAKGRPFKECLKFTAAIEAGSCNENKPCRDDFICAEGVGGEGVCAPPYSLFQLRLDGHSKP